MQRARLTPSDGVFEDFLGGVVLDFREREILFRLVLLTRFVGGGGHSNPIKMKREY